MYDERNNNNYVLWRRAIREGQERQVRLGWKVNVRQTSNEPTEDRV